MRFSAFLCAAADFGVRFSYNAISLLSTSYDMIVLQIKPVPLLRAQLFAGLSPAAGLLPTGLENHQIRIQTKRSASFSSRAPALNSTSSRKETLKQTESHAGRECSSQLRTSNRGY